MANRDADARNGKGLNDSRASYAKVGVDTQKEETGLSGLVQQLQATLTTRPAGVGRVVLPFGFFANVVEIGSGMGVAITTDGVGTKLLIAQQLKKYDTIGIDCVAMNVNDLLCVGA